MIAPLSEAKTFNWTQPLEYMNGEPLSLSDIAEYRLYCDGVNDPRSVFVGGETSSGAVSFVPGSSHSCYLTSVHADGDESSPSNSIEFIETAKPKAPVLED